MTTSPRGSNLWGFSFVPRGAQPIAFQINGLLVAAAIAAAVAAIIWRR